MQPLYEALAALESFMDAGSLAYLPVIAILGVLGMFLLVLVHEAGHAVMAVLLGQRVREVRVSDRGGHVLIECGAVRPIAVILVFAAGPAASAAGGLALGMAAASTSGPPALILALWTLASLVLAVQSLRPQGDPTDESTWNDGMAIVQVWRQVRSRRETRLPAPDPNAATSVAPPLSPRA